MRTSFIAAVILSFLLAACSTVEHTASPDAWVPQKMKQPAPLSQDTFNLEEIKALGKPLPGECHNLNLGLYGQNPFWVKERTELHGKWVLEACSIEVSDAQLRAMYNAARGR